MQETDIRLSFGDIICVCVRACDGQSQFENSKDELRYVLPKLATSWFINVSILSL